MASKVVTPRERIRGVQATKGLRKNLPFRGARALTGPHPTTVSVMRLDACLSSLLQ